MIALSVVFSPDGLRLVTGGRDGKGRVWDSFSGTCLLTLTGHSNNLYHATFSHDGKRIATAGEDGTVRLWAVADPAHAALLGAPIAPNAGAITQVAFSPDGHTLAATGQDKVIREWDVRNPAQPTPRESLVGHTDVVSAVGFSPDGQLLASGGTEGIVRLWNTAPGAAESGQPLRGHSGTIRAVVFSSDGRTMATSSDDDSVMLWDVNIEDSIRRICASTQGVLTPHAWEQTLSQQSYQPPCP